MPLAVKPLTQDERAMLRSALTLCIHHWNDGMQVLLDTGKADAVEQFLKEMKSFSDLAKAMRKELDEQDVPEF